MRGFWCTLFFLLLATSFPAGASEVRIAVLAIRGPERATKQWIPTADYLHRKIPEHVFSMLPMTLREIALTVERNAVDFVITNTGQYVELEALYGISRIATLKNRVGTTTTTEFGAVIFTRADRMDIQTVGDLRGKSMMAILPDGFGGYQMALRELLEGGFDPRRDAASLRFSGYPGERIAYAVASGEVDVGTFRSGLLEALDAEGKIHLSDFKALNRKSSDRYPGLLSTRLYPEWPFSRLRHTSVELAERVAVALINMPADAHAAQAAGIAGWTVPLDYYPVHELFMELEIGPYAVNRLGIRDLLSRYWPWLAGIGVLTVLLMIITVVLVRTYQKRRKVERELTAHQAELMKIVQSTTEDLVRTRDDALAASDAKTRFLANMSHELRTPLNAVIGYSEMMSEAIDDAQLTECRSDIDKILSASHYLLTLIDDLFDVSTIETGKPQLHLATLNIRSMVQDVISVMRPLADANHNELMAHVDDDVLSTMGDVLRVKQILFNVINNSCKFTTNGRIDLNVTRQNHNQITGVLISVKDSGCGMSEIQQSRVFERFHSVAETLSRNAGAGLGLAMSRVYCEAMGGYIAIESRVGAGTTVYFWLPDGMSIRSEGKTVAVA